MVLACSLLVVVALAALLAAEKRNFHAGKWIAKPIASAGFVGAALAAGAASTRFGQAVLVALLLSFVGDVLLIATSKRVFRAGLFSFLLGHLAFAAAFVGRGIDWRFAAGAAGLLVGVVIVVARWLLPHVEGAMRGPVIAYIIVISCMVASAAGTVAARGRPVLLVAAVAFFTSDLSVARNRFVAPSFANRLWGLPLYYFAQLLFASSV
jgi:uncharacterized membrane protein YhhN